VVASELRLSYYRSDANIHSRNSKDTIIPKKGLERHRERRIQFGALPYRFDRDTRVEILRVASCESERWIIPKGRPIKVAFTDTATASQKVVPSTRSPAAGPTTSRWWPISGRLFAAARLARLGARRCSDEAEQFRADCIENAPRSCSGTFRSGGRCL
jgi:hypothetical protein